jgi:hypothetical protein
MLGDFCAKYDVMNALFGHETIIFAPDGTRPGVRLRDGAWDGPGGPQHRSISAVLVFHNLNVWSVLNSDFWFVHNPWAKFSLSSTALPFTQSVPNQSTGRFDETAGKSLTEVLNLPISWPPDEI